MGNNEFTWQGKPLEQRKPTIFLTRDPIFEGQEAEIADLAAAEQRLADLLALVGACGEAMIAGSNKIIALVDALYMRGVPDDPLVRAAMHEQGVVQGRLLVLGLRARGVAAGGMPGHGAAKEATP